MILIGTIYHPPDSCQEDNLRLLRHIQENVDHFLRDHPEGLVLVSGDFNPTSTGITELTTKRVAGLTQIIKVLTRDTGTLDWCLTNRSKLMASPKQLPKLGKSDPFCPYPPGPVPHCLQKHQEEHCEAGSKTQQVTRIWPVDSATILGGCAEHQPCS